MLEFSLIVGFFASMLHVVSGPDHLAAVLPLAIETKNKAWKIGLTWGIGHLLGMLFIGVLFMLFKELIPVDQISAYSEQLVGIVLLGIGAWAIYKILRKPKNHSEPLLFKTDSQTYLGSLSIGILHGLAGIAHFLIFLPVLSFETQLDSALYLVGFAIGTVLAMIIFTFIIGRISSSKTMGGKTWFFNGMRWAGGLFAIIIGGYWLIQI